MKKRNKLYVLKKSVLDNLNRVFRSEIRPIYKMDNDYDRGLYDGFAKALTLLGFECTKVDGFDTVLPKSNESNYVPYFYIEMWKGKLQTDLYCNKQSLERHKMGATVLTNNERESLEHANKYLPKAIAEIEEFLDVHGLWN